MSHKEYVGFYRLYRFVGFVEGYDMRTFRVNVGCIGKVSSGRKHLQPEKV